MGSVFGASAVAHNALVSGNQQFATSSADIAADLQLSIQHEMDLVVSAQAFDLDNPNASEMQFVQWAQRERAMARYPELQGIGTAQIVPAAQLAAFESRPALQAADGLTTSETFTLDPAGVRAFYCFTVIGLDRTARQGLPRGFDLCAGAQGRVLLATRDSGQFDVQPTTSLHTTTLSFSVPTYAGGQVPPTVAQRRSSFVGWVGMSVVPRVLLVAALRGHPGTAVELHYGGAASHIYFRDGAAFRHPQVTTVTINGGWTILVSQAVARGGSSVAPARSPF